MGAYPLAERDAAGLVRSSLLALDGGTVACTVAGGAAVATCRSGRDDLLAGFAAGSLPAVIAIGAFDGVHVGHRALVGAAAADAARRGVACVAVTFDPDPADVLVGAVAGSRLLAPADRAAALLGVGADAVLTVPFTHDLAALSYQVFVDERLAACLDVVAMHVGADFRIGRGGEGDVDGLASLGRVRGFAVSGHPLVRADAAAVTSTRIRRLLHAGDVDAATGLLARPHMVRGVVEHGRGEGTAFGFPTANVRVDPQTCMPEAGVYATYVVVGASDGGAGTAYAAATNVGAPPTFTNVTDPAFLEAALVGFSGDLYGADVSVVFCHRMRDEQKFETIDKLEHMVQTNIRWVRDNLGGRGIAL